MTPFLDLGVYKYYREISTFAGTAQFYLSQEGNTDFPSISASNGNNGGNYTYVNTVMK